MAIIAVGSVVGAISGNMGASNYAQGRYGAYVRRRIHRADRGSTLQLAVRAYAREAHRRWWELSDEQRLTWDVAAGSLSVHNRLGTPRYISGAQLHFLMQVIMEPWGLPEYTDPPQPVKTSPPFNVSAAFSLPGTFDVAFEVDGPEVNYWHQWSTARPVVGRPVRPVKHWRMTKSRKGGASPYNLYTDFEDKWGVPVAGEYVYARMRTWKTPGTSVDGLRHFYSLPSPWIEVEAQVT